MSKTDIDLIFAKEYIQELLDASDNYPDHKFTKMESFARRIFSDLKNKLKEKNIELTEQTVKINVSVELKN